MRDDPDETGVGTVKPKLQPVLPMAETAKSKWKPPVLLPLNPNFLRLTSERNEDFCDEFAVMLQNEEFLAELR